MRIGLYCRQLISIGGGNLHTLAIAEHLSRTHQVDILTHTPHGAAQTLHRFGLDLSRIHLRLVPLLPDEDLAELTAEYDLFINRVHNVLMPNRARRGVLLVLFPMPIRLSLAGELRRRGARWLQRRLLPYRFQAGVYGEEHLAGDPMWLLAGHAAMQLAPHPLPYAVTFRVRNLADADQQMQVFLDGAHQQALAVPALGHSAWVRLVVPPGRQPHRLQLVAEAGAQTRFRLDAPLAEGYPTLALTDFRLTHPAHRLYRLLFEQWLPGWKDRLLNPLPDDPVERIASYHDVWSISAYTQRWTRTYWHRDSRIIHPSVDVDALRPLPKEKWILSVGRFFVALHNKKHLVMVEAFKEMCRQGLQGWELHLAGEAIDNPEHQAYLRRVQAAAAGYPIHIHTNLSRSRLAELYGRSAIYWHAAGYGADEARQPDKFEHFGITTVEAMAAGCAPVVIGKGGQPEIVVHGESGFVWQTLAELQGYTRRLVEDAALREAVSAAAQARSRVFDRAHFRQQVDAALESGSESNADGAD